MTRALLLSTISVLLTTVADAQQPHDFTKGVYASTEKGCAALAKDGLSAVQDGEFLALTSEGVEGLEYNCEFLNLSSASGGSAWVATAFCQVPGMAYPDLVSVSPLTEDSLLVTFLSEFNSGREEVQPAATATEEAPISEEGEYYFCAKVPKDKLK